MTPAALREHVCAPSRTCCCYQLALEPHENCPIHGGGEWPPRCAECGKFLKWKRDDSPYPIARLEPR